MPLNKLKKPHKATFRNTYVGTCSLLVQVGRDPSPVGGGGGEWPEVPRKERNMTKKHPEQVQGA